MPSELQMTDSLTTRMILTSAPSEGVRTPRFGFAGVFLDRPILGWCAAEFWYRWFGGQWQEPQIVLLDHGLIVEIPDELRQQYCQLWCSFVLNDQATAQAVATQIAGKPHLPASPLAVHTRAHSCPSAHHLISSRAPPVGCFWRKGTGVVVSAAGVARSPGPGAQVHKAKGQRTKGLLTREEEWGNGCFEGCVMIWCTGKRGGDLLPKLLRPGALRSEAQRQALRTQAGAMPRHLRRLPLAMGSCFLLSIQSMDGVCTRAELPQRSGVLRLSLHPSLSKPDWL